ncbi:hypothetical protein TFLX_06325 [Thermoflexales bacterium]|nr:hypothetical protein TFLX_06325 [Thermoflexales bacterium]
MAKKTKTTTALRLLTEADLKRWIGATLKAECAGSRLTPYTCGAVLPSRGSDARAEGYRRR